MGKVFCKRHERFFEAGASCDYCETPAALSPKDIKPSEFGAILKEHYSSLPRTPAGRIHAVQELLEPRDENNVLGHALISREEAAQLLEVPADAKCPECGGTRSVGGHGLLCPTRPTLSTKEREFVKEMETFYGVDAKGLSYPEWSSKLRDSQPMDLEQALKDAAELMLRETGKPDVVPAHGVYRELTAEEWNQIGQSPAASMLEMEAKLKAAEDKIAADFWQRQYRGHFTNAGFANPREFGVVPPKEKLPDLHRYPADVLGCPPDCGICKMVNSALRPARGEFHIHGDTPASPSNLEQLANAPPSAGPVEHQWSTHQDLCLYCGKRGSELTLLDAKMPCWFYAEARAEREREGRQVATDRVPGAASYTPKRRTKMKVEPVLGGMAVDINYGDPQGPGCCGMGAPLRQQRSESEIETVLVRPSEIETVLVRPETYRVIEERLGYRVNYVARTQIEPATFKDSDQPLTKSRDYQVGIRLITAQGTLDVFPEKMLKPSAADLLVQALMGSLP